jgi:hypothetical protein
MSGWSSPFAKWVVEGWAEHSKAVDGPSIAARLRRDLLNVAAKNQSPVHSKSRSADVTVVVDFEIEPKKPKRKTTPRSADTSTGLVRAGSRRA